MRELIKSIDFVIEKDTAENSNVLEIIINSIKDFYARNSSQDSELVNNILIDQIYKVYNKFFHHTIIFHFINELFKFIECVKEEKNCNTLILEFINEYENHWSQANKLIFNNLVNIYDINNKSILLHSNSITIINLLKEFKANNINIDVYQTVSYPEKEGITHANNISDLGFNVTLVDDLSLTSALDNINIVFLGADSIFEDYFINKSGSKSIAILAKNNAIPIFVISDSRKILNQKNLNSLLVEKYSNEKSNVNIDNLSTNVKYINNSYEKVPNNYVSRFIIEKGVYSSKNINSFSNQFSLSRYLV